MVDPDKVMRDVLVAFLLAYNVEGGDDPLPPPLPPLPPIVPGSNRADTMVELLEPHLGDHEWTGYCEEAIRWFYNGSLQKVNWCAITVSYLLYQVQVNVKNANVYGMMLDLEQSGAGQLYRGSQIPDELLRGDICFWLWSGTTMGYNSSKHVNLVYTSASGDTVMAIGGNQADSINVSAYSRSKLYAIFRLY